MKILDFKSIARRLHSNKTFERLLALGFIMVLAFGFVTSVQAETAQYTSSQRPTYGIPAQLSQVTPPAPKNTDGGALPVGLDAIQILRFKCVFSQQGCDKKDSLLDSLITFLTQLAIPLAILVIMYGGYRYFFGGFTGKADGLRTVQAAVTGLVLVLTAQLITSTVNETFSTDLNTDAIANLITQINGLLVNLAVASAILVIVWGGYQYFFGSFSEKSDGLKTIKAGVTGLVVILTAQFLANTLNELFKGITEAGQASQLPDRVQSVLKPILDQVTSVLQGLAGVVSVLVIVWGGYQYFFSTLPNGKKNGLETISKGVTGLVVTILALPLVTLVQQTIGASNEKLSIDPASIIFTIQTVVTNFLIPVSTAITVFFIVLGAYQWLTAGGDAAKVKAGRESLRNAVIGLIVVLLATTFTQLIIFIFRNTQLNPSTSTPTTQTRPQAVVLPTRPNNTPNTRPTPGNP